MPLKESPMKKALIALGFLAALPLAAAAQTTKEDLKKLVAAGVGDDVILAFVRANGPAPKLSADDVAELKKAGASNQVLASLMGTAPSAPAPRVVEKVVEKEVYVPRTTYVTSPAYYTDAWYSPSYYYSSAYAYPSYTYRPYYSSGWCYPSYRYSYCAPRFGFGVSFGRGWCR
jgi:hypothetical protein